MTNCKENGNVLVYILIAVALLASLTYAISRDSGGQQQNQLSSSRVKLLASDLIKHVVAAEQAVFTMTQWGTNLDEIRFDLPTDAGYTSNTSQQVYNPSGGGLQPFQTNENHFDTNGTTGWKFQGNVNVGWSTTTATDLIYTFINVNDDVCAQINNQLRGTTTIPTSTVNFDNTFTESATDNPFIVGECADCENIASQCITDGTTNAFYTILDAR